MASLKHLGVLLSSDGTDEAPIGFTEQPGPL